MYHQRRMVIQPHEHEFDVPVLGVKTDRRPSRRLRVTIAVTNHRTAGTGIGSRLDLLDAQPVEPGM